MSDTESKGNILVIEPDTDYSEMLRIYFTIHGYIVYIATTVEECLQTLSKEKPDIVFFATTNDYMAHETEFQVAARCDLLNIKIVFLVEHLLPSQTIGQTFGRLWNLYECMSKPFDIYEVHKKVDTVIKRLDDN